MKFSAFAKAIKKCDTVLRPYGIYLTDILINENNISENIVNLFLGLIGLQVTKTLNFCKCILFLMTLRECWADSITDMFITPIVYVYVHTSAGWGKSQYFSITREI
jgi:hypothetical protein